MRRQLSWRSRDKKEKAKADREAIRTRVSIEQYAREQENAAMLDDFRKQTEDARQKKMSELEAKWKREDEERKAARLAKIPAMSAAVNAAVDPIASRAQAFNAWEKEEIEWKQRDARLSSKLHATDEKIAEVKQALSNSNSNSPVMARASIGALKDTAGTPVGGTSASTSSPLVTTAASHMPTKSAYAAVRHAASASAPLTPYSRASQAEQLLASLSFTPATAIKSAGSHSDGAAQDKTDKPAPPTFEEVTADKQPANTHTPLALGQLSRLRDATAGGRVASSANNTSTAIGDGINAAVDTPTENTPSAVETVPKTKNIADVLSTFPQPARRGTYTLEEGTTATDKVAESTTSPLDTPPLVAATTTATASRSAGHIASVQLPTPNAMYAPVMHGIPTFLPMYPLYQVDALHSCLPPYTYSKYSPN